MVKVLWRGDAQGRAQVTPVTISSVTKGRRYGLTCNRKDLYVTATDNTIASLLTALASSVGQFNNTIPEWAEISAAVGRDANNTINRLVLTGLSDGTPFTVSAAAADPSTVDVAEIQAGTAAKNEIQRIALPGPPTGGTFTLSFAGQTTAAIAYNASAATVQAALEALTNIGVGDVSVSGSAGGPWTVEFLATYAATNVPTLLGIGTSLTGAGKIDFIQTQHANWSRGELQAITPETSLASARYFRLTFRGYTTDWIAPDASADTVRTELEALASIGSGCVAVQAISTGGWNVRFFGGAFQWGAAMVDVPLMTITTDSGWQVTATDAVNTHRNDVIELIYRNPGSGGGGTFTLTYGGATTGAIAWAADAATLDTALEALASTSSVGITNKTDEDGTSIPNHFIITIAPTNNIGSDMTANTASTTGGEVMVEITQDAAVAVNEVNDVRLSPVPTGGTFTLTHSGNTTAAIAYNATAATLTTELEALASIGVGDVTITGNAGGPWRVEFTGSLAGSDQTLTGTGTSLTGGGTLTVGSNTTEPTGPHHADNAENYSGGALPGVGDILVLENNAIDIKYGLTGLTNLLAEFHQKASFTGKVGLKPYNEAGYAEYRTPALTVKATKSFVGEGGGSGSTFSYLDFSNVQTELIVYGTGEPDDSSLPALLVKGTHASNVMRFFKGSWGTAVLAGDTSTVATLQVGYLEDRESDAEGFIGPDATLTTIQVTGGDTTIDLQAADAATLIVSGGELTLDGTKGITGTFRISGDGTVFYNTTGALAAAEPIIADTATLDFSRDMRAKTVDNPILRYSPAAKVVDPFKVAAPSAAIVLADPFLISAGLVIADKFIDTQLNGEPFGNNVVIARGVPA